MACTEFTWARSFEQTLTMYCVQGKSKKSIISVVMIKKIQEINSRGPRPLGQWKEHNTACFGHSLLS